MGVRKIITLLQKKEWMSYIKKSSYYDFYHSWAYHTLDNSGIPILFVFEENDNFIAFPLIKRKIPATNFNDLSSVYGYSGPISNKKFKDLPDPFIQKFKLSFIGFLFEENIISVFSRLHPFFDQDCLLKRFGGLWENGKVVVIDLKTPIDDQRSNYQKTVFRKIKQLKQKGYVVRESNSFEEIQIFTSIYNENMLRLGALNSYKFSDQYFITLLNSEEIDARLLFVYNEVGYPICGSIIVFTNQIIQAHLLATRKEYYFESPAKLLFDEISLLGREMGMKYFNLGGGVGFKEDSLFNWKSSFSKVTFNYYSWRYIVNQSAYNTILDELNIDPKSKIDLFPLYRIQFKSV